MLTAVSPAIASATPKAPPLRAPLAAGDVDPDAAQRYLSGEVEEVIVRLPAALADLVAPGDLTAVQIGGGADAILEGLVVSVDPRGQDVAIRVSASGSSSVSGATRPGRTAIRIAPPKPLLPKARFRPESRADWEPATVLNLSTEGVAFALEGGSDAGDSGASCAVQLLVAGEEWPVCMGAVVCRRRTLGGALLLGCAILPHTIGSCCGQRLERTIMSWQQWRLAAAGRDTGRS